MKTKKYKHPAESEIIKTEVVCPTDTNPLGVLKGGRLVEWMDMASAGCAQIHSGSICVTAAINHVGFVEPAKTGDIITIIATITRVFHSSMEIFARAYAQSVKGQKKSLISEAYFTFVALDDAGKATEAVSLKPLSATEKKKYDEALVRKKNIAAIRSQLRSRAYDEEDEKVY